MDEFEKLLADVSSGVERFVRYRLPSQTDADDVLQEVYLSAYRSFSGLKNKDAFKPWLISIARNKCNDYFRSKAAQMEISIEELSQQELSTGRQACPWYTPCGKPWNGSEIKISRFSTCTSGKSCPKPRLQRYWTFQWER